MVRDEDGKQSQVTQVVRDVVLPAEPPPATGDGSVPDDVGYTLQLDLRPGPADLMVGVWDEVGGGESYVFQKVVVGGRS